jgi:prepilin-type processing-associated H-X9-DG protein
MTRIWNRWLLAVSLMLSGSTIVRAQAAPPAVPGVVAALPVAQFVDETTFLVADINIAAVDLDACRNWLIALTKKGELPAQFQADLERDSAGGIGIVKDWQTKFTKAGGTHVFIIVSGTQDQSVIFAFPLAAGADMAALKQVLSKEGGLPAGMFGGGASDTVGNVLIMGPPKTLKQAKETAANPQRTPRPDLAAAFAAGGAATHRLAFSLPEQFKGALIIQQPKLPEELGGGATAPVINAFKYATLTLTTPTAASPKIDLQMVVQARDAAGAQKLKEIADTGAKLLRQAIAREGMPIPPELIDQITPQVAGDKLKTEITQGKVEGAAKPLVASITKARERAKRTQSMSNMRQILMANMMYANENKGALPAKVPDDVSKYLFAGPGGDAQKMIFTNPANGRFPGYVYLKPADTLQAVKNPSTTVMLYEAYDAWPQGGIGVGFADGHVETVADEASFKKMLNNK